MSTELRGTAQAGAAAPPPKRSPVNRATGVALTLALLSLVGIAIRLVVAHQSLFADELSTYWISSTHSLPGVISLMYGTPHIAHAEITPPLYFVLAWATSQLGHSPEWLRAPSLIAGIATIPLVYLVGLRTFGRPAALLGAALTALAPFMIYYSGEARAYALMMALVLGSTVSLLAAVQARRGRWWVLYGLCSCAALYTHYTCVFALATQAAWALWAHPEARRWVLLANLGAAAGLAPWLPGLLNDLASPTETILSKLSVFTPHQVRLDLEHFSIGYPYAFAGGLRRLPGTGALVLLGISGVLALGGIARRVRRLPPPDARALLMVAMMLSVPVGEALVSASGNHIFGARNLAASWPYMGLCLAAVLSASGGWTAAAASAVAIAAFALGAARMLSADFARPDTQAAAAYVAAHLRPGDVVIDGTGATSPGPLTSLDTALRVPAVILRAGAPAERGHPYSVFDSVVTLPQAIRAAVRRAHGHRVFLVLTTYASQGAPTPLAARLNPVRTRFPAPYRPLTRLSWAGIGTTALTVYGR